ncbi:hypothetical protein C8Q77DRAFT_1119847 [Trametes polyzona]|nr:hypothetical protein C8Q77DRAFT_1119847 [Trametes polyzona]
MTILGVLWVSGLYSCNLSLAFGTACADMITIGCSCLNRGSYRSTPGVRSCAIRHGELTSLGVFSVSLDDSAKTKQANLCGHHERPWPEETLRDAVDHVSRDDLEI